jgi:hypothetical protein
MLVLSQRGFSLIMIGSLLNYPALRKNHAVEAPVVSNFSSTILKLQIRNFTEN